MKKTLKCFMFVTIILLISFIGCDGKTEKLPWEESFGRFYTKDITRAQKEIPFQILLPTYIPNGQKNSIIPQLTGPLRQYQYDGKVEINILYLVKLDNGVVGTISINESNYPVLPGDPSINPGLESIEINEKVVIREGNPPDTIYYYFTQNNIYFVTIFYDFPSAEALKVIESMIK